MLYSSIIPFAQAMLPVYFNISIATSLLSSHDATALITVLYILFMMFNDTQMQEMIERLQSIEPIQQLCTWLFILGIQRRADS